MRKAIQRIFLVSGFTFLLSSSSLSAEIAIVVNKNNPVDNLALNELVKIFKADRQYWDGEKIFILMRESTSWEKNIILKKVYQMSGDELNKFWLGKVFRGEINNFPAVFGSENTIKKLIAAKPGAISFVNSRAVDDNVKVLKIDGKLPGEKTYPLGE